jgi:hypothetical protein
LVLFRVPDHLDVRLRFCSDRRLVVVPAPPAAPSRAKVSDLLPCRRPVAPAAGPPGPRAPTAGPPRPSAPGGSSPTDSGAPGRLRSFPRGPPRRARQAEHRAPMLAPAHASPGPC